MIVIDSQRESHGKIDGKDSQKQISSDAQKPWKHSDTSGGKGSRIARREFRREAERAGHQCCRPGALSSSILQLHATRLRELLDPLLVPLNRVLQSGHFFEVGVGFLRVDINRGLQDAKASLQLFNVSPEIGELLVDVIEPRFYRQSEFIYSAFDDL
jgi:hypothetical protein